MQTRTHLNSIMGVYVFVGTWHCRSSACIAVFQDSFDIRLVTPHAASSAEDMLNVFTVSGELLTSWSLEEPRNVQSLKIQLQPLCGVTRFRQKLLHDGTILQDDRLLDEPLDLQLVLLPFRQASSEDEASLCDFAYKGNVQEVERMLQQPQEPGLRPLDFAVAGQQADTAALLLEAGARSGYTLCRCFNVSLHSWTRHGRIDSLKFLLDFKLDVNQTDSSGLSALWLASGQNDLEAAQILLEARADVDQADKDGQTPLWGAACLGNVEMVHLLLTARPDPHRRDKRGISPLDIAVRENETGVVLALLESFET